MTSTFEKLRVKAAHLTRDMVPHLRYGTVKPAHYSLEDEVVIIPWNSDTGRERLLVSKYNHAFFHLAHTYQPQKNPFYCGVASMVTILNALRLDQGVIPSQEQLHYDHYNPETQEVQRIAYRIYSQLTLLDDETDKIKPRDQIAPKNWHDHTEDMPFNPGLTLEQVRAILELYQVRVRLARAIDDIDTGITAFRDLLMSHLVHDDSFIIVNFEGKMIGAEIGGHFSVVGAYHRNTDSVLIMDAAAHKMPWYWVDLPHLYFAMNTGDADKKRGYLVVSEGMDTNVSGT